ncbi:MAG: non-canonical purine NTP pyrophosphatase [Candidatus Nanosynbacter sp.]|nr:non-canonical purine NTP pyrophosphatase [Candidatus Nanosynbacter sp.]
MTATILFATRNPGKHAEFVAAFHKFAPQMSIISLADLDYQIPDCIETGTTFEQNALLKARHTRHHLHENDKNLIIIADDSGMEIDALNGEPGVFTRRWDGREMSDQEIVDYCLKKLENKANRRAQYTTCLVINFPNGREKVIFGKNSGVILIEPREESRLKGMPFRELFFVPELNMMFHEVRELPKLKRNGYLLGHEVAVRECSSIIQKNRHVS